MELQTLLPEIEACAREAGAKMRTASADKDVTTKTGRRDLVTRYDREIQRFLEERLLALLPEAGFLGEEDLGKAARTERDWLFIVDPIDGTTNFVKNFCHSCTSIALALQGRSMLGVIYDPYRDELFSAVRGGGAALNGEPLHTPDLPLADSLVLMGMSAYYRELTDLSFALARDLFENALDLRQGGSAALDLCDVARGRAGCYFECRLSPWDYAAGSLIVEEAGGLVTDLTGAPLSFSRKCSVAAGSRSAQPELLRLAGEAIASIPETYDPLPST